MNEKQEKEIIEKAKFKFNVVNHGTVALKDCILESILEVTHLTESQLANVFGLFYGEDVPTLNELVEKIYKKMGENNGNKSFK